MAQVATDAQASPSSTCSRRRARCSTPTAKTPLTINGDAPERRKAIAQSLEIIDRELFGRRRRPTRRPTSRVAAAGGARQEPPLVQPLPHDRRLRDLRRPRVPHLHPRQSARRQPRREVGRSTRKICCRPTTRSCEREVEVLDVMTANRDQPDLGGRPRRSSAAADGSRRSTTATRRRFINADDQRAGQGAERRAHLPRRRGGASSKMKVGKGLKVELFASEKQFPELVNPVQMAFDTEGPAVGGGLAELSALEAEDADGRQAADPRRHRRRRQGRQAHGVRRRPEQPDRLRVLQRRRARRAGARTWCSSRTPTATTSTTPRRSCCSGLDSADTHHAMNSFTFDPGGALYFQEGTFHHTQVETPWAPTLRQADGGVFRFEPRTLKFEIYIPMTSPTRTATSSTHGAGTSSSTGPAGSRTTARRSRPRSTTRRWSDQGAAGRARCGRGRSAASRSSRAGTSPTTCRATWSC